MTYIFSKLSAAWSKAREQEVERVQAPPLLTVHRKSDVRLWPIADNLDNLAELIKTHKKLEISLPNRLRIDILPSVEDKERFAVRTIGNFREALLVGLGAGSIVSRDFGPSSQAERFNREIAGPLSKTFGCKFGDYGGLLQNITLAPVTPEQAGIAARAIEQFTSDQTAAVPSFFRTARGAIRQLTQ